MISVEIYPGETRTLVETGAAYSVFDETALGYLGGLGLGRYVTKPDSFAEFLQQLSPEDAFPGVDRHHRTPPYLLTGENEVTYVLKPFSRNHDKNSGLRHLGTQELLHTALKDVPGYNAARVFGYIGLSRKNGEGYAIVQHVDAFSYHQIEGEINFTSSSGTIAPAEYTQHYEKGLKMLPPNTTLSEYMNLALEVRTTCNKALSVMGISIPATVQKGRQKGSPNWDFNYRNLLCTISSQGRPELTIIDQTANLSHLTPAPYSLR